MRVFLKKEQREFWTKDEVKPREMDGNFTNRIIAPGATGVHRPYHCEKKL